MKLIKDIVFLFDDVSFLDSLGKDEEEGEIREIKTVKYTDDIGVTGHEGDIIFDDVSFLDLPGKKEKGDKK